ncbi:MAG: hypothetical protein J7M14_02160, partial [Planctomycetes bacterium]|nr:hypothetical protein [Planctomycetota bacterium]
MTNTHKVLVAIALTGCVSCTLLAWHEPGHERITREVAALLPPGMPAFFRAGASTIVHCSADPDAFTRPIAPPQLHAAESPEHYFDVELLANQTPPPNRYDFIALCNSKGIKPNHVGMLPYAVTEWTQRLMVAFAEYRKWPDNPHVHTKCLVYAGLLAHYAEDACQPLHTTIHYDGRATADGRSPRSGIH